MQTLDSFTASRFSVPESAQSTWGFQVRRDIQQTSETDLWNAAPRGTQGVVSRFGHLVFSDRLAPPRRIEVESAELAMVPKTMMRVEGPEAPKLMKLLDALEDLDDVQKVWTNADIDESLVEA